MTESEEHLVGELKKIVEGIGKMFGPFCEVVLHDLRTPDHSIVMIQNSVTGRSVGDPATGLGLARLSNPDFPDILQNFRNFSFSGKELKSTSIGIRNEQGDYIAVIGLNLDVETFSSMRGTLDKLLSFESSERTIREEMVSMSVDHINNAIQTYSDKQSKDPKDLTKNERRELVHYLYDNGWLSFKNAIPTLSRTLGVTRTTIYNYLKEFG